MPKSIVSESDQGENVEFDLYRDADGVFVNIRLVDCLEVEDDTDGPRQSATARNLPLDTLLEGFKRAQERLDAAPAADA